MDTLLTPEDVAARLVIKPSTVKGWLRSGQLEGIRIGNKFWRIPETSLKKFLGMESK